MFGAEEILLLTFIAPGGTVVQVLCQPEQSDLHTKKTSCSQAAVETFPNASFLPAVTAVTSIWLPLLGSVLRFGLSLTSQSVVKLSRRLSEGFTFLYFYFSNDSIPAGLTYG